MEYAFGKIVKSLYNFAPIMDECERYYYDPDIQVMYMW